MADVCNLESIGWTLELDLRIGLFSLMMYCTNFTNRSPYMGPTKPVSCTDQTEYINARALVVECRINWKLSSSSLLRNVNLRVMGPFSSCRFLNLSMPPPQTVISWSGVLDRHTIRPIRPAKKSNFVFFPLSYLFTAAV